MMSLAGYFINTTSPILSFFQSLSITFSSYSPPSLLSFLPPRSFSLPLSHPAIHSSHTLQSSLSLTLPSSTSSTPLLISPLLSSLLLYQSLWQKINISATAAFLPFLPRASLLTFEPIFLSAAGSFLVGNVALH